MKRITLNEVREGVVNEGFDYYFRNYISAEQLPEHLEPLAVAYEKAA